MKYAAVHFCIILCALMGCTSFRTVAEHDASQTGTYIRPSRFVALTRGGPISVLLKAGPKNDGTMLNLIGDTLTIRAGIDTISICIHEIESIVETEYILSLLVYPAFGALVIAPIGREVQHLTAGQSDYVFLDGGIFGAAVGAVAGALLGVAFPVESIYHFPQHHFPSVESHAP